MNEGMDDSNNDARVARQISSKEKDTKIREKLQGLLTTEWSKQAISKLRSKVENFFNFSFQSIKNPDEINKAYGALLPEMAEIMNASIASGRENLEGLENQKGVIVVTNHFGIGHLAIINNEDRKFPAQLPEIPPFPARLAALSILSRELNVPLYETAVELPQPLLELQQACNTITVAAVGEGRTEKLVHDVQSLFESHPGAVVVMYPEAGTTGKESEEGPYDLEGFHSGAFVVAAQTGAPILPVCQYLDGDGFKLYILKPLHLTGHDLERVSQIEEEVRTEMQDKLNSILTG